MNHEQTPLNEDENRAYGLSSSHDDPLSRAFEAYLRRFENGESPNREDFLSQFPELGTELEDCLEGLDLIERIGPQIRTGASVRKSNNREESVGHMNVSALGDFRILRELGRGGMGIVYEAEQLSLGRRVALKVLPFASLLDKRHLARFQNEVRAAAMLKHPHIVSVYQSGCDRGVHYYAMELIEGRTLADPDPSLTAPRTVRPLHDSSGVTLTSNVRSDDSETVRLTSLLTQSTSNKEARYRTVAELGLQAADALYHAHQHGVIHRDIKPSNMLLDESGKLFITDFGLARSHATSDLTLTGDVVGTLRYMSPEQLRGGDVVDHRTDIYSLGVTLYELLTHQAAHVHANRVDLIRDILESEPRAPRSIDREIPRDLETIVCKSLAKAVEQRYHDMQALADDLQRFLSCQTIRARKPSVLYRTKQWLKRNQLLAWLVAMSSFVIACAAVFGWMREARLGRERERANANLETAWRSVFIPPAELTGKTDPATDVAIVSNSIATLERLKPQVPMEQRREFDENLARLLVIRAEYLSHQGNFSHDDSLQAIQLLEPWLAKETIPGKVHQLLQDAYDTQSFALQLDLRIRDAIISHRKRLFLARLTGSDDTGLVWLHGLYAEALRVAGQLHEAEKQCRIAMESVRRLESSGNPVTVSLFARSQLLEILMNLGAWDQIDEVLQEADQIANRFEVASRGLNAKYWYGYYRICSARVANLRGNPDEAIATLENALDHVAAASLAAPTAFSFRLLSARCLRSISDSYVLRRDWAKAESSALAAVSMTRTDIPVGFLLQLEEVRSRHRLAQILYATNRTPSAYNQYDTAIRQLNSIRLARPSDPITLRAILAVAVTCPFEDLPAL
ncbi:MAG: serine/threonine protein kinase [Planctomycetales bacterium]|nr:serine/threonine protein kinase [Planctomycetales bacterium]